MPVPVGCFEHGLAFILMAGKTVFGHGYGINIPLEFYQVLVIRNFSGMTCKTIGGRPGVQSAGNRSSHHGAIDNGPPGVGYLFRFLVQSMQS